MTTLYSCPDANRLRNILYSVSQQFTYQGPALTDGNVPLNMTETVNQIHLSRENSPTYQKTLQRLRDHLKTCPQCNQHLGNNT